MVQQSNNQIIDAAGEIKSRLDIIEVVSEQVALKKSGRNYWGLCPFHKEKSPSFSVNPDKGIYKCFGCGAGGDSISFLMKTGNKTFYEVLSEQAEKFGIALKNQKFSSESAELKKQILEINHEAVRYFNKLLLESPEAQKAREYLFKRSITEEVIQRFGLGYSLNSYDALIKHFKEKQTPDMLLKAGLVSEKTSGNGYVDRFRGRIMIPIQDEKGSYIAFGARATEEGQSPKYLNSPETLVFNKSRSLFALYQAKEAIKEQDRVIIMEGFFDVISAHIHGLSGVVATLGTALTDQHIKILARYTDSRKIYLAFDSDEAGINATDRGAEIIKSVFAGLGDIRQFDENFAEMSDKNNRSVCEIRVVSNSTGKDPDEFIRTEGIEAYKKVIEESPLLIDYQINRIIKLNEGESSPQGKAKTAKEIVPVLADIKNSVIRNEYIKLVCEKLGIDEESLSHEVKSLSQRGLQKVITKEDANRLKRVNNNEEKHILAQKNLLSLFFLNDEKLSPLCINNYLKEVEFSEGSLKQIKDEISTLIIAGAVNESRQEEISKELLSRLAENEDAKQSLVDVICSIEDKKSMDAASLERYINDHIAFLKCYGLSKKQNELKARYHESNNDEQASLQNQKLVKSFLDNIKNGKEETPV